MTSPETNYVRGSTPTLSEARFRYPAVIITIGLEETLVNTIREGLEMTPTSPSEAGKEKYGA